MKITLEAENDAERELFPEPRTYPMAYEFMVCGYSVTGRFSHFHGDPEFLFTLADFAKRNLRHVGTPDPK